MRFYLVLANMRSECIPIRMFASKAEAMEFAKHLRGCPPEIEEFWPYDFDTHHNNIVVEFKDGRPVGVEFGDWGDEEEYYVEDGYLPGDVEERRFLAKTGFVRPAPGEPGGGLTVEDFDDDGRLRGSSGDC